MSESIIETWTFGKRAASDLESLARQLGPEEWLDELRPVAIRDAWNLIADIHYWERQGISFAMTESASSFGILPDHIAWKYRAVHTDFVTASYSEVSVEVTPEMNASFPLASREDRQKFTDYALQRLRILSTAKAQGFGLFYTEAKIGLTNSVEQVLTGLKQEEQYKRPFPLSLLGMEGDSNRPG